MVRKVQQYRVAKNVFHLDLIFFIKSYTNFILDQYFQSMCKLFILISISSINSQKQFLTLKKSNHKIYTTLAKMNKTLGDKILQAVDRQKSFIVSFSVSNLPSISLNQLENQVNNMRKKKNQKDDTDQPSITNNKEFHVCSPFYDRMKAHKQNCKCPYHKKKQFSIKPVRHSHKKVLAINKPFKKLEQHEQQKTFYRFSSKQTHTNSKGNLQNKQLDKTQDQIEDRRLSHTQIFSFKPKTDTRNVTYETFLKECEYHLLKKKGFSLGKPGHVVRKGVKQIFQFINNHLDYTHEKMAQWVNKIQKDKDYGQFYVERFLQMKKNYEIAFRKRIAKDQLDGKDADQFQKNNQLNGRKLNNFKSKQALAALLKEENEKKNKQMSNNKSEDPHRYSSYESSQRHKLSKGEWHQQAAKMSQMFLNKIFNQLQFQGTISDEVSQDLMKLDLKSFKLIFEKIQKNLLKQKYTDEMLQKFDSEVLSQLLKKLSNASQIPPSISDIQSKIDIIKKTQEVLKKHRSRKQSKISSNSLNQPSTSRQALGSRRNTQIQIAENIKNTGSDNSKKSSGGDGSITDSEKYLIDSQRSEKITSEADFGTIERENELDEESSFGKHRMLKAKTSFGSNSRRSRMFKPDEFNFHNEFRGDSDGSQSEIQRSRKNFQLNKGVFKKAERYLFDANMGTTIINEADSIFTAKRKMRVIKILLKQNPHSPEADQLRKYVKEVEEKIVLKTQKDKKLALAKRSSGIEEFIERDIWKLISLDNLGFNLIFYNLTSKIGSEDNDDLCLLLNEWRLYNIRKLDNQLSFKMNLVTDEEEIRKSKKKTRVEDILVQEDMGNMEFQPKMQSQTQIDNRNKLKINTKTIRKDLIELNALAEKSNLKGFLGQNQLNQQFTETELNGMNNLQIEAYYKKIKGIFKYAKVHYPQTFDKYIKNNLINDRGETKFQDIELLVFDSFL